MAENPLKKPEAPQQQAEKLDRETYLQRREEIMQSSASRRAAIRQAEVLKEQTVDTSKEWEVVESVNLISRFRYGIKSPAIAGEKVKMRSDKIYVSNGIQFVKVWVNHTIGNKQKWVTGYIPLRTIKKTEAPAPEVVRGRRKVLTAPKQVKPVASEKVVPEKVETPIPEGMQKLKGNYKITKEAFENENKGGE